MGLGRGNSMDTSRFRLSLALILAAFMAESALATVGPPSTLYAMNSGELRGGAERVAHRRHTGTPMRSFSAGIMGSAALAVDPVDGTLWMSNGRNTLYQFSQLGTLIEPPAYSMAGQFYGMEFETTPVPEPAS